MVTDPINPLSLLNYALVNQIVNQNYDRAEKFYRKAISCDPNNTSVLTNYDDFLSNRLPGGYFSGGGPGYYIRKRSLTLSTNGEWILMRDPEALNKKFSQFWFNTLLDTTQWNEPDWDVEWRKRRERGIVMGQDGPWTLIKDSAIGNSSFYFNIETGEYLWSVQENE